MILRQINMIQMRWHMDITMVGIDYTDAGLDIRTQEERRNFRLHSVIHL